MMLPVAWLQLEAEVNQRTLFGLPGVRDPDAPCESFKPVENIDWLGIHVRAPGYGTCDSDGHYLCMGCEELSRRRKAEILDVDEEDL